MSASPVRAKARAARAAALRLQTASDEARRRAVEAFARRIGEAAADVEQANGDDLSAAEREVAAGRMSMVLLKRLSFRGAKIRETCGMVHAVAGLPDPLGRTVRSTLLDDGLKLWQVTVPIGVVACAFESRPDAAVQVAALAMRTGNALLLKGGAEAERSNAVVARLAREALEEGGLPADGIQLVEGRAELRELLDQDDLVDLIVPRGSSAFVRFVQEHTRIPVLGHAEGICHTYVDETADVDEALRVCLDAKLDYPAACNATETFLVHEALAPRFLPRLAEAFAERGVELRVDEKAARFAAGRPGEGGDPSALRMRPASPADFGHEFGDLVAAVAVVGSVGEAIEFINAHSSRHTDAILTRDEAAAERFVAGVDSAGVYVNASTRFADGYRYGLGAEVGISTGKVHHRGPVGLAGLTTTKWVLVGRGHVAADYQGEGARPFKHEPLEEDRDGIR